MSCPHENHANLTRGRAALVASAFLENRVAQRKPLSLWQLRQTCSVELAVGFEVLAEQFLLAYSELAGVDPLAALEAVAQASREHVMAGEA